MNKILCFVALLCLAVLVCSAPSASNSKNSGGSKTEGQKKSAQKAENKNDHHGNSNGQSAAKGVNSRNKRALVASGVASNTGSASGSGSGSGSKVALPDKVQTLIASVEKQHPELKALIESCLEAYKKSGLAGVEKVVAEAEKKDPSLKTKVDSIKAAIKAHNSSRSKRALASGVVSNSGSGSGSGSGAALPDKVQTLIASVEKQHPELKVLIESCLEAYKKSGLAGVEKVVAEAEKKDPSLKVKVDSIKAAIKAHANSRSKRALGPAVPSNSNTGSKPALSGQIQTAINSAEAANPGLKPLIQSGVQAYQSGGVAGVQQVVAKAEASDPSLKTEIQSAVAKLDSAKPANVSAQQILANAPVASGVKPAAEAAKPASGSSTAKPDPKGFFQTLAESFKRMLGKK